jgi:hypothetical protein
VRVALDGAKAQLVQTRINDDVYWMSETNAATKIASPDVHLLAGFDEYLLGYTDRRYQLQAIHNPRVIHVNGIFLPVVVINGKIAGTWRRTIAKGKVFVTPDLLAPLNPRQTRALDQAVSRFGEFMSLPAQRMQEESI